MSADDAFTIGGTARVRSAVAPLLGSARIASPLVSQLTAGHVVTLLARDENWWQVRGRDGYDGWAHAGYLEAARGDEHDWPVTTGALVREADGRERALPLGARVAPDAMLVHGDAYDDDERTRRFPPYADAVAASAETLFAGASYLWGGTTPWGCDCSGFTQAIFALHGVLLPRDAWQQTQAGEPVSGDAFEAVPFRPADLLFFSDRDDRRITHVALWLDGDRFVHSALARGGVGVESLDRNDPYIERLRAQYVTARRVVYDEG